MMQCGYIKSNLTGNELCVDDILPQIKLPEEYNINLGPVRNQGQSPKCVSVSLTDMVKWHLDLENIKARFSDSLFYTLDPEATKQGMSPKNAFEVLIKDTKDRIPKAFDTYGIIKSLEVARRAILQFGPIMVCMKVKSTGNSFWNGPGNYGGHAVLFTGFNKEGFILRNSWGLSYGINGYSNFPYSDFDKIMETWVLIK